MARPTKRGGNYKFRYEITREQMGAGAPVKAMANDHGHR